MSVKFAEADGAFTTYVGTLDGDTAPAAPDPPEYVEVNVGDYTWGVYPAMDAITTIVGTVGEEGPNIDPSTATVTGTTPATVSAATAPNTVTVNGTGFKLGAQVVVDGVAGIATFVSETEMTFTAPTDVGDHTVAVQNYGEDPSGTVTLAVTA